MTSLERECEKAARWATRQFILRSWTRVEYEDTLQEARLGAWRACQRVPSPTFTTAAYGAKNALMDYGRALGRYSRAGVDRKVEAGISLDDPDVVWEVSGLEDDLTQFEVLGRLERLEERDRVIALMTYLGFTQDEIADQLGVTASRISQLLGGRISRELSRAA